jgi:glycosyltransferase involved in cell wall biosynthesis
MNEKDAPPVLFFCLRRPHPLTGEGSARRFMMACFQGVEPGGPSAIEDADQLLDASFLGPRWVKWLLRPLRFWLLQRSRKPDTLIFTIPTLGQLPFVRLLTLGYSGRVIIRVEGLCWRAPQRGHLFQLFLNEPLLTLSRVILNNAYLARVPKGSRWEYVVSSRVQTEEIGALDPGGRIHRIPNSFHHPGPVEWVEGRPGRALRIGYLGHSYLIKGAREFLLALEILKKQNLPLSARFAFSGMGSRSLLRSVEAAGYRLDRKVSLEVFFAEIDLLVCPYWVDWGTNIFPNVLLESLFFGVPVLTTDLPLTREIFQGADPMAIFAPGPDPASLAAALGEIISGRRALPGRDALTAFFAEHFDPERTARQWKALLAPPSSTL